VVLKTEEVCFAHNLMILKHFAC